MSRFDDAAAQAGSLSEIAHRPWPLKREPWLMGQSWQRLLFAHFRVPRDALRAHVPESLVIEEWDGSAWLGLTPFRVAGLRLRGAPPLPLFSSFCELNCRTYVCHRDRPGIWFFSLDASSRFAVEAARLTYRLPYHWARIAFEGNRFAAERRDGSAFFRAEYRGIGGAGPAEPGTLEYFLVERYCLYSANGDLRAEIHHLPWSIERAEATVDVDGIAPVPLEGEPLYHYADRQDVVVWRPEAIAV